jgi:hypothetical protein
MKKITTLFTATLSTLLLAHPALAQSSTDLSVSKPENVNIVNLGVFISKAIQLLVGVAAILLFVFLVWGGIQWLTSGGDKTNVEAARNRITNALIGLAIVALAWALQALLTNLFGLGSIENTLNLQLY